MRFFWALLFAFPFVAQAQVGIKASASPQRSRNGESITLKVRVSAQGNLPIRNPDFPRVMTDWRILNTFENRSMQTRQDHRGLKTVKIIDYSYVLQPMRQGKLKTPALEIAVGSQRYKVESIDVQVDNIATGSNPKVAPKEESRPRGNRFGRQQNPDPSLPSFGDGIGENELFFIRTELSKKEVYVGELIVASYVAYSKSRVFSNPEITQFPVLKGFLKEDLVVPTSFKTEMVNLDGEAYYRTELIRYALFPLKEGEALVDPLTFRVDVNFRNQILNNLLQGIPLGGLNRIQSLEKSSKEVKIRAKALPPVPENFIFTGAVGEFRLKRDPLPADIRQNQPFGLSFLLEGRGNLKSILAPELEVPDSIKIESKLTKLIDLEKNASGSLKMEYLLLASSAGKFAIPEQKWLYFDPKKEAYQSFPLEAFELSVSPSSTPFVDSGGLEPEIKSFTAYRGGRQNFHPTKSIGKPWIIGQAQFLQSYVALGIFYILLIVWRKRQINRKEYYSNLPWKKTEKTIKKQRKWEGAKVSELIDLWIQQRLQGALREKKILDDWSWDITRDELKNQIASNVKMENRAKLEQLEKLWHELDHMRFTDSPLAKKKLNLDLFHRAEKLSESIVSSLR